MFLVVSFLPVMHVSWSVCLSLLVTLVRPPQKRVNWLRCHSENYVLYVGAHWQHLQITLNNSCAAAMQLYSILSYFDHLLSLLLLSDDCFLQLFNVEARVPVGVWCGDGSVAEGATTTWWLGWEFTGTARSHDSTSVILLRLQHWHSATGL